MAMAIPVAVLARLVRRRRAIVLGALVAVVAASWAYLWLGAGIGMEVVDAGGTQTAAAPPAWSPPYALLVLVMWVVMMAAMMLPTAAPTVLLVAALAWERFGDTNLVPARAMLFAVGYLLTWCGFSLLATLLQWGLDEAGLLSDRMALGNAILAGAVLVGAGVYQLTPLKDACLRHCRSPTDFLVRHWRRGALGAVRTGVRHGLFCLGCCWMLMALLFVGGGMNVAWIGVIALFVLLEKTVPWGARASRLGGLLLLLWGTASLVEEI